MHAYSPNGTPIIGTLETITARAEISADTFARNADGSIVFEYEGETEVFWDDQETVRRNGEVIYLDEDGGEWTAAQIVLKDDDEEDDDEAEGRSNG